MNLNDYCFSGTFLLYLRIPTKFAGFKEGLSLPILTRMREKFRHLLQEAKTVKIRELRFDLSDYLEFVIPLDQIELLCPTLEKFFGEAIPHKVHPDWDKIENFMVYQGGIRPGQTLYYLEQKDAVYYAMIWPWSDQTQATVRVERVEKKF